MASSTEIEVSPTPALILGGPLYRILRRSHSSGSLPELLSRQAVIVVLICWAPLVLLALVQAHFTGGVKLSFFHDIDTQVRFLISLPVLILAEIVIDRRILPIINRFVERRVVTEEELPEFYAAVRTAARIHNSVVADILLVIFVYAIGTSIWRHLIPHDVESWYASTQSGQMHLTMAGYWLAFVSVPVFQFILLRWYMQIVVWFWLIFRISRFKFHFVPLHPDRAGGIGFVGGSSMALGPLLFAHSALISGLIASHILYNQETLRSFEIATLSYIFLAVGATLAPLCLFTFKLVRAKRGALARYGNFASELVTDFDEKWLKSEITPRPMMASEEIQTVADLDNSFKVVREMRYVPISPHDVFLLFAITTAPFLPLLLTVMPIDQLIVEAMKLVF
jgi:hypothetical protein